MSDAPASAPPFRYSAKLAGELEGRWQAHWAEHGTFQATNPHAPMSEVSDPASGQVGADAPKAFIMDMFPYPSGAGLHVGHPLGYIATDVYARYLRMTGHNVLHTIGYDAFGLPAEQYAIRTGQHPRITTEQNIATYRRQLARLGLAHDERRAVATTDPGFVKWTQWIFLQLFDSWYDPDAVRGASPGIEGGLGQARPIAELVEAFASGARPTPDGRPWAELSSVEQRTAVDDLRLAYRANAMVNWCPGLGTVLANEEVTSEGRSERGDFPVFRRPLTQWMLRITAYADRLDEDLGALDWPEPVKLMQHHWIGRSTGASVRFASVAGPIEVFTTRPDTLFGATYMVLAPEHELVDQLLQSSWPDGVDLRWTGGAATPADAVAAYRASIAAKTEVERTAEAKEKTGVFTGCFATNPVNGAAIPIFIADYVLAGYGTGAIMAVPAHDERDFAFARAFGLPVVQVVTTPEGWSPDTGEWTECWHGDGVGMASANSGVSLDGLPVDEAKAAIIGWLEAEGIGAGKQTTRLRDWLFSRQRYWGEPFPIVFDETGLPVRLPDSMLPLELPELEEYAPTVTDVNVDSDPEPPLGRAVEWANVVLDLGLGDGPQAYTRELNTMPNWAGSCWYYLRYQDPTNELAMVDAETEEYWMGPGPTGLAGALDRPQPGGVDLYVGGVEHAVLHLLYSRFWHKVLFDLGHVSTAEPFQRLFNQGMIQAFAYRDSRGLYVPAAEVVEADGGYTYQGEPVTREYGKMGKTQQNIVTPDDFCRDWGADTLRLYEMSMGPLEISRPWSMADVIGAHRLLQRAWRAIVDEDSGALVVVDGEPDAATAKAVAKAIVGVGEDLGGLRCNTAIAKVTELVNHVTKAGECHRSTAEVIARLLSPLAPHVAEELWSLLGHGPSVGWAAWPEADRSLLVEDTVTLVIQINGKVKDRIEVAADASLEAVEATALASPKVVEALAGGTPRKVIARPPTLVNVVV